MQKSDGRSVRKLFIGRPFDDDWGLADPTGCEDEVFKTVIREIEKKLKLIYEK